VGIGHILKAKKIPKIAHIEEIVSALGRRGGKYWDKGKKKTKSARRQVFNRLHTSGVNLNSNHPLRALKGEKSEGGGDFRKTGRQTGNNNAKPPRRTLKRALTKQPFKGGDLKQIVLVENTRVGEKKHEGGAPCRAAREKSHVKDSPCKGQRQKKTLDYL